MVCVKKNILQHLPIQVREFTLIKVDLTRIKELYFSNETCIVTKNTDNIVIIRSTAHCILTMLRWEDNLRLISMNIGFSEKLSIDLRDIGSSKINTKYNTESLLCTGCVFTAVHHLKGRNPCIHRPLICVVEIKKERKRTVWNIAEYAVGGKYCSVKFSISPEKFEISLNFWEKKNPGKN